jgi:hypothetical protein
MNRPILNKINIGPKMFKSPKNYTFHKVNVNKCSLPFKSLLPNVFQNEQSMDAPFLGQTEYVTSIRFFVHSSFERNSPVLLFPNKSITIC